MFKKYDLVQFVGWENSTRHPPDSWDYSWAPKPGDIVGIVLGHLKGDPTQWRVLSQREPSSDAHEGNSYYFYDHEIKKVA